MAEGYDSIKVHLPFINPLELSLYPGKCKFL